MAELEDGFDLDQATLVGASYIQQLPRAVRRHKRDERGFQKRLGRLWRKPLELFEGALLCGLQSGGAFNDEERSAAKASNDAMISCLLQLHARACLVCSEILALLKTGHASGAYGRWRTLHETAATAWFISEGDARLATKFLDHQFLQDLEDAEEHQAMCAALGREPIPEANMNVLLARRAVLENKYPNDPEYFRRYGWAAEALGSRFPDRKGKRIGFAQIERAAEQDYMRSLYSFASHSIHSTSKGLSYEIGLVRQGEVLQSGPSDFGLAEPAILSLVSFRIATAALLMSKPNPDRCASLVALSLIEKKASKAFQEVEARIARDYEQRNPARS